MNTAKMKNGFSLAEMMIVILILSIFLAAAAPIMTRKFIKSKTTSANGVGGSLTHGSYECYRDQNGNLYQIQTSSENNFTGTPSAVASCTFTADPTGKNADVIVVGGGGGGGKFDYYRSQDGINATDRTNGLGAIGEQKLLNVPVLYSVTFNQIGTGGANGDAVTPGFDGTYTSITVNGQTVLQASGGTGGLPSLDSANGSLAYVISNYFDPAYGCNVLTSPGGTCMLNSNGNFYYRASGTSGPGGTTFTNFGQAYASGTNPPAGSFAVFVPSGLDNHYLLIKFNNAGANMVATVRLTRALGNSWLPGGGGTLCQGSQYILAEDGLLSTANLYKEGIGGCNVGSNVHSYGGAVIISW